MIGWKQVKERLEMLGYDLKAADLQAAGFCAEKVCCSIKNKTHLADIPKGLEYIAVDMAVGEFLQFKKTFAPGDLTGFDLDYAVKQIQEGDTNIVFAAGEGSLTAEQRLDRLISHFLTYGQKEFMHYRRLQW